MQSEEIRKRFLTFFENQGYSIIPSASLVPEGDASTLFINSGMQPLVPYLLGQKHPKGNKLVNVQKSWRTGDIDEVGDNTHNTFFEMLGRWHLGELNKKEVIESTYLFLTSKKDGLGLNKDRIYASIYVGGGIIPQDEEASAVWDSLGVPYYFRGDDDNLWSAGNNGPCGPSSEVFYDVTDEGLGKLSAENFQKADDEQKVIELWNDVFMSYDKKEGKVVGELKQQNVDTGVGLERVVAVVQGKNNVFATDLFAPLLEAIDTNDRRIQRIVADHIRSAVFAIADGVVPSNTDRGYIVRRLIRRAMRYTTDDVLTDVSTSVLTKYKSVYPELESANVLPVLKSEMEQFRKTLERGLREFEKGERDAFVLFTTYGFPLEMTIELAREHDEEIDVERFKQKMKEHQEESRSAAAGKFKGGLADSSEETVKLHTAHHLLLAALQKVLGKEVKQRGSNITQDRLRIDFSFERKLTDEEKNAVEDQVNQWIEEGLRVVQKEMPREEAEQIGAEMEFGQKYPDTVSVYFIGPSANARDDAVSIEFCGGPHVENTGTLGTFKITSEKSSSAGIRRIKAVLQ